LSGSGFRVKERRRGAAEPNVKEREREGGERESEREREGGRERERERERRGLWSVSPGGRTLECAPPLRCRPKRKHLTQF
jgi:hypothetical protein